MRFGLRWGGFCGDPALVASRNHLAKTEVIEFALPSQFSRRIVHALLVVGF